MSEALDASREEVRLRVQQDADNALMHKQQMEAVNETMREQQELKDLELKR